MAQNLALLGGLVHSQQLLLALTVAGVTREEAYRLVQRNAMRAHEGEGRFRDFVEADADIAARLSPETLAGCFDEAAHLRHVDTIFERVFGTAS
jgi:adenylosuccinate lyase